ncbi:MAG: DUF4332 domain-containing protein [Hahellaceae bacterium]|jgi:DNA transformation protein|nr:DUF4332 domain-containing protein [Hahellaceae bacterium]MCP5210875.1 DUF4332 domain-containing protein [Hahellaceae bacterium]
MKLRDLRGLGPKSEAMLVEAGIHSVDEFLQTDPYQLYKNLKEANSSTSLNFLYAIIGAQENCDWREIARLRKTEILITLDDMGIAP